MSGQRTAPDAPIVRARATRTTIFLKILMAASGLTGVGFLVFHMYGNLKAFGGERKFNHYAQWLREVGDPVLPHSSFLWSVRVVLIVAVIVHVYAAFSLWKRASRARPTQYAVRKYAKATITSRTMRWGGITLLLYIIWHLINFTIGRVNVTGGPTHNRYRLMVDSFNTWWLTVIYLIAMAALGAHLHHGIWSAAQTLGLTNSARARAWAKQTAVVTAILTAGGFALVPVAVFLGIIT